LTLVFYALNSPKIICQDACSTPPEPIAELRGPPCGREEKEGKGEVKEGKERAIPGSKNPGCDPDSHT